jgi:hypothetical protein
MLRGLTQFLGGRVCEVAWQQFVDPVDRIRGDALEHDAQIRLRLQAVESRGADQAVERGGTFPASVRTGKEVVLAIATARKLRPAALLSISIPPSSRLRVKAVQRVIA